MKSNSPPSSRDTQDWKDKYLIELDKQEERDSQYQQLMALLVRAVVRISLVADGIDPQLDKQLAGLRTMLREGVPSANDLNTMVFALEGQVKRLDVVKSERAKVLVDAFGSMVTQLKELNVGFDSKIQLKRFNKSIKKRSVLIQEYSGLVNEYASLQRGILEEKNQSQAASLPFWRSWLSRQPSEETLKTDPMLENVSDATEHHQRVGAEPNQLMNESTATIENNQKLNQAFVNVEPKYDLARDDLSEEPLVIATPEKEPPFTRLSKSICAILNELLQQIEPPITAKQNYASAKVQIEKGLNWFELVPTLENISIVVMSAFDSYQKEFEQFLQQLNKRLGEANLFIHASEKSQKLRADAGRQLNQSMLEHVNTMQQKVESATELDQLKYQVKENLDNILAVMDHYQNTEKHREGALSEQLNALIGRVKTMEKDSASAEQRIEEQRQRALRDVLTQLPNREAYQARLEQEFERWQRYSRQLSLVVCDIDHFKRINDSYGHLAGDKVLRIIAKSLAVRLRKTDFIARFGGEEFVILMPETDQNQALSVVEVIRSAIASCPFHFKESPVTITLSFGITEFKEDDKPESAFLRADKALYAAKELGRNCCQLAEAF